MSSSRTRLVAFDLDGTLVDSRRDIASAANLTLGSFGLARLRAETVVGFIGGGVRNLALRCLTASADEGARGAAYTTPEAFVERFLTIYGEHLLDETVPYPGVVATLKRLRDTGHETAVVTNKPSDPARRIVEGLSLGPFAMLVGGDSISVRKPDPEPLLRVIRHVGVEPSETLYVGDMSVDVETAAAADVPFLAVTWGLGTRTDLELAGATRFINRIDQLSHHLPHLAPTSP